MHFLLQIFTEKALAALPPAEMRPPCDGILPGCGKAPANIFTNAAFPEIARILLNTAAGLSMLFVIIGGARYVLSFARENEQEKAKMTIFWALVGLIIALTSHRMVMLVISEPWITNTGEPIFSLMQSVVRIVLILLNITFLLVIVLGGMRMVYARGAEEEVKKGRDMVGYAIIGVIIINIAPYVVKAFLAL